VIEIHFIGTSDAFGAGGRRQSAFLVSDGHAGLLVDCGMTTNTGLAAERIQRDEVDAILVSHFHADHFGGIPLFLLAAFYADDRSKPLVIAGPPGIESQVMKLGAAMGHSLADREWTFPIVYRELPAGKPFEVGPASVTSFEVNHDKDACPHGHQIQIDNRKIVYSGDTGWFEGFPQYSEGADLFVCECTYCAPEFNMHLNLEELTKNEASFQCDRMVLTHLGSEMSKSRNEVKFETADDGLVLKV
jgi:ribonuclease BN (tRNA processing enzyme)